MSPSNDDEDDEAMEKLDKAYITEMQA